VLEGAKLVNEALDAGVALEALFVAPGGDDTAALRPLVERASAAGVRVHGLGPGVLERVAATVTPQPVLAVAPWCDVDLGRLAQASLVVVCVDVRDPGNAGTVLRSAEAAGADGVVFCEGSVDVFNPKTVRASAGAVFHVPVVRGGAPAEVLDRLGGWGLRRLAATARGGEAIDHTDLVRPLALVIGNEASGLPAGLVGAVDVAVTIPMVGRAESLNVGMAAAVVCFEALRQRRAAPAGGQSAGSPPVTPATLTP